MKMETLLMYMLCKEMNYQFSFLICSTDESEHCEKKKKCKDKDSEPIEPASSDIHDPEPSQ